MTRGPVALTTTPDLVRELERLECDVTAAFNRAAQRHNPRAEARDFAGGKAFYTGPDEPFNAVKGVGVGTPVTQSDLDAIAAFFRERGCVSPVCFDVCPYAEESLFFAVTFNAFPLAGFEQVHWREVSSDDRDLSAGVPGVTFAPLDPDRAQECALLLCRQFSGLHDPPAWQLEHSRCGMLARGVTVWTAIADGVIVAASTLCISGGSAGLAGAAVHPNYRARGIQTALLTVRLRDAARQGCTLAKVDTKVGTTSQRNAERLGFRLAYTRAQFMMPVSDRP